MVLMFLFYFILYEIGYVLYFDFGPEGHLYHTFMLR